MAYESEHFIDSSRLVWNYSLLDDDAIIRFQQGKMFDAYRYFGAHPVNLLNTSGYFFSVWAPSALKVSVVGAFNGWKKELHPLFVRMDKSGIWEGFIPRLQSGLLYKFCITTPSGEDFYKCDPYAIYAERRPATASVLWHSNYQWNDDEWMLSREKHNALTAPWCVYEMHLGSWMRPEKNNPDSYNTYEQIAEKLIPYLKGMHFTHVEFMPIMEHPFDGSWGYQITGYYAPTSRYGNPQELRTLIDALHQNGIGVILDWVPSHFPGDKHGLFCFDGRHTYEYADMRKGYHPDWNSYIFNYERGEVRSFLLSNAYYWLKEFHADGLRVDAVNSMIRLDYSRQPGDWTPNKLGGNENLEAIDFLKSLNKVIYQQFKGVQTIAEEASDWPGITHSINKNGFGFGMKWMMGWMHDTFRYFKKIPQDRLAHQNDFTFSMMYYYDEKFMLPLSHDEVVHGKSPMLYKMPGNEKQKFSNLRLLYTYLYTHPGAKLLFMGNDFGVTSEWNEQTELQWELLQFNFHNRLQDCVRDLNRLYRMFPALHECQFQKKGFEWININMHSEGILVYRRKGKYHKDDILVVLNVSNNVYHRKKIEIKGVENWVELFNSDDVKYEGSGQFMNTDIALLIKDNRKRLSEITINIPPISGILLAKKIL